MAKTASVKEGFTKLANHVQDPKAFRFASRTDMLKIADTISTLDEKEGLERKYDVTLPDPLLTVFNTSKVAEESISLGGKNISINSLMSLDPQTYGDVLGEDIIPEITKEGSLEEDSVLDVLKTLPADLQSLFVQSTGL